MGFVAESRSLQEKIEMENWNEENLGFGAAVEACQRGMGCICDHCRHVDACRGDEDDTR